jgi:hypothetical protein
MKPVEILQKVEVRRELQQAWIDSSPGVSGGHEEGGFIVTDDLGTLSVIRWEKGLENEIILPPHNDCILDGKDIVSSFHTHPNTGEDFQQEPSLTDIRAVRDDLDLKGQFYVGEFVISQENIYLVEPSGQVLEIGNTNEMFG